MLISNYIKDFLYAFTDMSATAFTARFLGVALAIGFLKMGIDLVFPKRSKYRTFVYVTALILTALFMLDEKGIALIAINQYIA